MVLPRIPGWFLTTLPSPAKEARERNGNLARGGEQIPSP